jgi:hypothetical protein
MGKVSFLRASPQLRRMARLFFYEMLMDGAVLKLMRADKKHGRSGVAEVEDVGESRRERAGD